VGAIHAISSGSGGRPPQRRCRLSRRTIVDSRPPLRPICRRLSTRL
jgi:hypothetical protein